MVPRVTVIMATYNWSSVLRYSIASVLDQTFTDFELLVVGDGCTDDSEHVVRSIADPRVHWVNLASRFGHQSGPNNEGLRRARGELIAYIGHDDLWLPHHLASAVAVIDQGADLAYSIIATAGPGGTDNRAYRSGQPGEWMAPTSVVHRKRITDMVGGWRDYRNLRICPITDLWRRTSKAGFQFAPVPRLTAIKLPASARRDVYRETPSHEQAEWLQRIRTEPDLEVLELANIVATLSRRLRSSPLHRVWDAILWVAEPLRWPGKGGRIKAAQRYKGVHVQPRK